MKVVLCTQGFTKEYVMKICEEIPKSIHVVETSLPDEKGFRNPQHLCVISGSRQTQAEQSVKIKLLHAANQVFTVALSELDNFFQKLLAKPTAA